jgi:hypothetical protein
VIGDWSVGRKSRRARGSGVLQKPEALKLTDAQVGMSATFYLAGNVFWALLFWVSD